MVVVDFGPLRHDISIRGKLGRPWGLGEHWFGWTKLGDKSPIAGYYQKRKAGEWVRHIDVAILGLLGLGNNFLGNDVLYTKNQNRGGQIIVKMRHYWPTNKQTETQQNWRAVFANGVEEWHALTTEQKLYYNRLKHPARQSGFTRFMSKYLSENYPPV